MVRSRGEDFRFSVRNFFFFLESLLDMSFLSDHLCSEILKFLVRIIILFIKISVYININLIYSRDKTEYSGFV